MRGTLVLLAILCPLTWVAPAAAACPNESLRNGYSAHLPDCRAYELVTPPDTNGLGPTAVTIGEIDGFDSWLGAPSGDSVIFDTVSGSLPGVNGNGVFDEYRAVRGPSGWQTGLVAPTGAQSEGPHPGGVSPDHLYASFRTTGFPDDEGSLQVDEAPLGDSYVRTPAGSFEAIGKGSLGEDHGAVGRWITAGATHIIFTSSVKLEGNAPETGIEAVYDRSAGGPTHVVSLLPGDSTPSSPAAYQGQSNDGSAVVFRIGTDLYERRGNAETLHVVEEGALPVGQAVECEGGPAGEATLSYRWLSNGVPIAGAVSATYTTSPTDAGKALQCEVTALTANAGSIKTSTPALVVSPAPSPAPPVPPVNLPNALPANPVAGTEETCATGTWSGAPTFSYQWYANGVPIAGATSSTYTVQAADVPSALQCAVTGTNAGGTVTAVTRNRLTSPAPDPPAPVAAAAMPVALGAVYAGVSEGGGRVFFQRFGGAFAFDATTETATEIAAEATIVNVSADGSHVFFSSGEQLDGSNGSEGGANLYVWDGAIHFIAELAPADFDEFNGTETVSLGRWTRAVGPLQTPFDGPASVPARSTADGSVFVFQSHANLAPPYDSQGHSEIYRYDAAGGTLDCVSCNPSGAPATADAQFQSATVEPGRAPPTTALVHIAGVTADGETVFFQTPEALLPGDVNSFQDVYEWRQGDLALITSGQSGADNFIYGETPDGGDVFFVTNDVLVPGDENGSTAKIYDARVGGGLPAPEETPVCQGDACQGQVAPAPSLELAASLGLFGPGNLHPRRHRCAKPGRRGGRKAAPARARHRSRRARCHRRHHRRSHHVRADG